MGWSGVFGPSGDTPDDDSLIHGANEGSAALTIDTATTELWGTRAKGNLGLRMPIWYDDLQTMDGSS